MQPLPVSWRPGRPCEGDPHAAPACSWTRRRPAAHPRALEAQCGAVSQLLRMDRGRAASAGRTSFVTATLTVAAGAGSGPGPAFFAAFVPWWSVSQEPRPPFWRCDPDPPPPRLTTVCSIAVSSPGFRRWGQRSRQDPNIWKPSCVGEQTLNPSSAPMQTAPLPGLSLLLPLTLTDHTYKPNTI